jgi:hypothetical protein
MTRAIHRSVVLFATACLCAGTARAGLAPGTNLYMNGALASRRVIQHNGMAYVPVADVAKMLNQVVVTKPDGYAMAPAGGTNQVDGLQGKIGDKLTNGEVVLTVVKAFRTDKYDFQFTTGSYTPNDATEDVVVVVFHIKNARHDTGFFSAGGAGNTAVADVDEHAYPPSRFGVDSQSGAPTLLPGSATDFALCFPVPKNEKLKAVLYQMGAQFKDTTFRVSIASVNP